ncbi:MAG: type II TA system antitoxin MqsA family protein [Sedimentisphaerales bacterium]|jgi:putative zinc finger/helix-turn-helix YgiT family protein
MAEKCPICGEMALETRVGKYTFVPPPNIPGGPIVIENAQWEECASCKERILSLELEKSLENERYHRLGLLTPKEILSIRERAGLKQKEIAEKIGVGEKTYARWESGHSLHNTSSDNLIRLFARDAGLFEQVEAERRPNRNQQVKQYIEELRKIQTQNKLAIAAHGKELNSEQQAIIHKLLKEIIKEHRRE